MCSDDSSHYPDYFPIKIIGCNQDDLSQKIIRVLTGLSVIFDDKVDINFSKSRKYISITVNVYITSREYFTRIYNELNNIPLVRFVI
ncbi:YbeD family protein [Candidatus Kinetoplastidibacterium crithidiae]|uniref:Uncharacterized protein n=1 Tax=Candidatus Kinetoplastidibacterium crithidiae TCC036E TaxID=1208918 RepID=M1LXN2_9PROT|nr:DUF493 domain-containing protein [Candidatus Kinetoplastibacterium crithidii]AGF47964.1 protein of unknown function of the DUF493 family [Candidatus Kinetoplastibacterium crithidii TCC036E]